MSDIEMSKNVVHNWDYREHYLFVPDVLWRRYSNSLVTPYSRDEGLSRRNVSHSLWYSTPVIPFSEKEKLLSEIVKRKDGTFVILKSDGTYEQASRI